MIPENKQAAVKKALQTAFNTNEFEEIQPLTKGLSSALVFKIVVHSNPYLLRIIMRTDAIADPAFYYGCMKIAAEKQIAPRIHYADVEDRVSITDFIVEQPFSLTEAKQMIPVLLRNVHTLPKFPFRINYFDSIEKLMPQFSAANILSDDEQKILFEVYQRIAGIYPKNDMENWVSSHNDTKPENIVFDGQRPWLVDWEAAFLNDRYLDLAIFANFAVQGEKEETAYLEAYFFEESLDAYKRARFFLMQVILHFYYFIFLMVFDKGVKPIDVSKINKRDFTDFHGGMWNGVISLADNNIKREYAMVHIEQFRLKAQTKRFEESLRIVGQYHHIQ